ncbi:cell surface glycoprotein CD200 receptor 1 isoform X1 [Lacerta agilis]|uniref:cell surface glycoprotein CD200 receptor 1 isoform X1 n=1 Tax=Lacerta agilis TaxID=80427 RepID=UPI0014192390|nr:cell surface glycoprotein CD200 receptor 1 isoform X1 [Lacerta agilis]
MKRCSLYWWLNIHQNGYRGDIIACAMEAKCGINFVLKNWSACALLTVTVMMATIGSFPARGSIQNKSVQHHANSSVTAMMVNNMKPQLAEGKSKRDAVVGTEVVLNCPHQRPMIMVSWNANLKNGTVCYLSYISDRNKTEGNCSDNSMYWLSKPEKDSTLQIKSAQISSEGIYKCSTATAGGTFSHEHNLTILVPPEASLIHDDISGTAICKAVAGKPAAQISWSPEGEYNTKSEYLLNGTQTVTSIYKVNNSEGSEVTCFVSHPAWKESLNISLDGQSKKKEDVTITILFSSFAGVLGILLSVFIYLLYRRKREVDASKSPETMSRPSIQESELEPYAIFVQVENVIYEKAGDFPQSE